MNLAGILKGVGLGDVVSKGVKAVDDFFVSNNEVELERLKVDLAQAEVNREAARHDSLLVAGARPALLWICGGAFAYNFILGPALEQVAGYPMVSLEMGPMMTVLMGMLGLGGYRTFEKVKGVARDRIRGD